MKTSLAKGIKTLLGRAAMVTGIDARNFRNKTTIVAFHRVNNKLPEDGLTCPSAKFEAFCRFFIDRFHVVSLSEQVTAARAGKSMAGSLSITFDDGYLDNYEVAAPILRKLGLPATFFVTTGFIGSSIVPSWDQGLPTRQSWMSWDHVRSLASQGFEIGCHGDAHLNLSHVTLAEARSDLQTSQAKLAKELGMAARLFAYPFGGLEHMSEDARQLIRDLGFECCVSCHGGTNVSIPNPYYLNRIGIAEWFANPYQLSFEIVAGKA